MNFMIINEEMKKFIIKWIELPNNMATSKQPCMVKLPAKQKHFASFWHFAMFWGDIMPPPFFAGYQDWQGMIEFPEGP